jgi:transposase InsO family protein
LPRDLGIHDGALGQLGQAGPAGPPVAPDRVRRQFTAVAPDVLWCGDLTEVQTDEAKTERF